MRRHWPWLALAVFAMVLHFWNLGGRSYHHDEAIHAHSAFNLLNNGIYRYDPTYHGPLLYYLTAATYAVAGDSDFTAARSAPVRSRTSTPTRSISFSSK